ncbi:unnamed protein product, partial [Owenia fusiformis]
TASSTEETPTSQITKDLNAQVKQNENTSTDNDLITYEDIAAEIMQDIEDAVNDKGSDILEPEETKPCKFADCYSDTEDEDEDDDSEDDEEDFSKGINTFLECVRERRQVRDNHVGPFTSKHVGIENRVVAAATFEKAFCGKRSEKVNHLTVIAVRKRYQKWGIGRYLLSQLKNPQ